MKRSAKRFWARDEKALIGLGMVLPTLLLGGGLWWRAINATPAIAVPTPVLPKENAYDDAVRAANLAVEKIGDEAITPARDKKKPPLTPERAATLVAANQPAIQALRASFDKPFVNPPARSFRHLFPEFAKFRGLARALSFVAQEKAKAGAYEEAARCAIDAIEMGNNIPRGGVLIAELVGIACEAIGQKALFDMADKLDASTAKAAARRLETIQASRYPFAQTLTEEKYGGLGSLQEAFERQSLLQMLHEIGGSNENGESHLPPAAALRLLTTSKATVLSNYSRYMDATIARARLPYAPNRPAPPVPDDPINQLLAPAFEQADFKWFSAQNTTALLTAYLGLRAWHAARGDYPESLEALVTAGYLDSVPLDSFGNAPLRYRRNPDGAFLLYSVGPDGKDDGGRAIAPKNENAHWVAQGDNGDCVVRVNTY